MRRPSRRRPERNAGAFLGPGGLIPIPLRTLSDDYRDEPTEPEGSDRVPEPGSPGLVRRALAWVKRGAASPR